MIAGHQKAIAAFEAEASTTTNPELRMFAKNTLPAIRDRLKSAEAIAKNFQE